MMAAGGNYATRMMGAPRPDWHPLAIPPALFEAMIAAGWDTSRGMVSRHLPTTQSGYKSING